MNFETLRIDGLRCLTEVALELDPGINVFVGANGAGKTSVLEGVFLLSHGRSFRGGSRDALLQRGASALQVFASVRHDDGRGHRLGLGREGNRWQARVDGESAALSQLVRACAVVSFDPGSHALIAGPADERRRFLDWGLFHVEHDFFEAWRRAQRALKQRNALLRSAATDASLYAPWEQELAQTAQAVVDWRRSYLGRLTPYLKGHVERLLPELGEVVVSFRQGWPDDIALIDALAASRSRDLGRGHTTQGAHRADWSVSFEKAVVREHLSRGQEKLTALAFLLAQSELHADSYGEWPVICLDDLASELDLAHQSALVAQLRACGAQLLISGTELPPALHGEKHVFHVEQGAVTPLL